MNLHKILYDKILYDKYLDPPARPVQTYHKEFGAATSRFFTISNKSVPPPGPERKESEITSISFCRFFKLTGSRDTHSSSALKEHA